MKTTHRTLSMLAIFLTFTSIEVCAQNINYTLESDTVTISGDAVELMSTLAKDGNAITWTQYQNGKQAVTLFNIDGISENWNTATSSGNINYNLDISGHPSSLALIGNGNGLSAQLVFDSASGQPETYSFNITSITYN